MTTGGFGTGHPYPIPVPKYLVISQTRLKPGAGRGGLGWAVLGCAVLGYAGLGWGFHLLLI